MKANKVFAYSISWWDGIMIHAWGYRNLIVRLCYLCYTMLWSLLKYFNKKPEPSNKMPSNLNPNPNPSLSSQSDYAMTS